MNISVNLQKSSILCKSSFESNPAGFQPASALDSTTEAIGLFDPVSLDLRPPGWGFPYNFLHQITTKPKTKKKHKRMFYVWFQGAPSQWTSLLPQSSVANFDTPKKANKSLTGKKSQRSCLSANQRWGHHIYLRCCATNASFCTWPATLTHLPYQHAPTIVVDKYLRGKSQTTPGP